MNISWNYTDCNADAVNRDMEKSTFNIIYDN